jgi:hypothetical protein
VIKTGKWLEDRSKHDFAIAKSWGDTLCDTEVQ